MSDVSDWWSTEIIEMEPGSISLRGEPIQNKVIRIKELSIGQYKVKNVIAFVKTLETANSSLLGIGFLKKFSEAQWSLISNQLTLYK